MLWLWRVKVLVPNQHHCNSGRITRQKSRDSTTSSEKKEKRRSLSRVFAANVLCRQFRRARIVLKWGSYFAYFNHFPKQNKKNINLYFPETALNFTQNEPGPVEYTWDQNSTQYFQYTRKNITKPMQTISPGSNRFKVGLVVCLF